MTPDEIRELVKRGKLSREQSAKMLEQIYSFRRAAWRARIQRRLAAVVLAPFRWARLTRMK